MSSLCIARDKASAADAKPAPREPRGKTTRQQQKPPVPQGRAPIPQGQACDIHEKARPWPQWEELALLKSTVDGLQDKMTRHLEERMSSYAGLIYEEHAQLLARLVKEQIEHFFPGPLTVPKSNGASNGWQSTVTGHDPGGNPPTAPVCEHMEIPQQSKPLMSAVVRDNMAGVAEQVCVDKSQSGEIHHIYIELERLANQVNSMRNRFNLDDCTAAHPNGCRENLSSTSTIPELEASIASFSNQGTAGTDDRVRHLENVVGVLLSDGSERLDVDDARFRLQALSPADVPALGWYFRALHSKQATECSVGRDPRSADSPYLHYGRAAPPGRGNPSVARSSERVVASGIPSESSSGCVPDNSPSTAACNPLAFTTDASGAVQGPASPCITNWRQRSASPCVHSRKPDTAKPPRPVLPRPQRDERQILGSAGQSPMGFQTPAPPERAAGQSQFRVDRVPSQPPPPAERVRGQTPLQFERVPAVVHAKVGPSPLSGSCPIRSDVGSFSVSVPPRSASGPCAVRMPTPSPHRLAAAFPDGSHSAAPLPNTSGTQTPGGTAPGWGVMPAAAVTADGQMRPCLQHMPASQLVTQGNREDWNRAPPSPAFAFEGRSVLRT